MGWIPAVGQPTVDRMSRSHRTAAAHKVDRVLPPDELEAVVNDTTDRITSLDPFGSFGAKTSLSLRHNVGIACDSGVRNAADLARRRSSCRALPVVHTNPPGEIP